jgi:hypothetical protein
MKKNFILSFAVLLTFLLSSCSVKMENDGVKEVLSPQSAIEPYPLHAGLITFENGEYNTTIIFIGGGSCVDMNTQKRFQCKTKVVGIDDRPLQK